MKKLISLLSLSALLLVSCSKSSSPTSTNNNNNNTAAANTVVATINGTTITFKILAHSGGTYSSVGGVLALGIAGIDSATGKTIGFGGGGFVQTGTQYDLGLEHPTPVTSAYGFDISYSTTDANGNTVSYGDDNSRTAKVGTITISSISSTGAQGTFSATLPQKNPSGSGSVSITNGSFNVTF